MTKATEKPLLVPYQPGHLAKGAPAPWSKERSRKGVAKTQKARAFARTKIEVTDPWGRKP